MDMQHLLEKQQLGADVCHHPALLRQREILCFRERLGQMGVTIPIIPHQAIRQGASSQ